MMKRLRSEESHPDATASFRGGRVFACKTCNREFSSFQALGGHRASHRKPKIADLVQNAAKPKAHECSVCGLEFPVGQALGGHMRRHRNHSPPGEGGAPEPAVVHVEESVVGLDLNLTPLENDLVRLHLMAPPPVGCRT